MSNTNNILDYISVYASGNGSLSVRHSDDGPINRMVLEEFCKEGKFKDYIPMCNMPEDHPFACDHWCLVHPFSTLIKTENYMLIVDNLTANQLMVIRTYCDSPWLPYNMKVYGQDSDGEQFEIKNLSLLNAVWFYTNNEDTINLVSA